MVWDMIDENLATRQIVADGNELYQRHESGHVWKYRGTPMVSDMIDENPATIAIVADGGELYQLHDNGAV